MLKGGAMKIALIVSILLSMLSLLINFLNILNKYNQEGCVGYLVFAVIIAFAFVGSIGVFIWICIT